MLRMVWQEKGMPWKDEAAAGDILARLEHNPIEPLQEMEYGDTTQWIPYEHEKAVQVLMRGTAPYVEFRTAEPLFLSGSIARSTAQNTIVLNIPLEYLYTTSDRQPLFALVTDIAQRMPQFRWVYGGAESDPAAFYDQHGLPRVPACFNFLVRWYHLMSPQGYAPYYMLEELLSAPAHSVRELDNGWVELLSYADPLAYAQPESRERIIELTRYLDAHRRDR